MCKKNRIFLWTIAGPCDTWGHFLSCSRNTKIPSNNRACATSPSFPEKNLNTLVNFATMSASTSWDDQATRVKGFRLNLGNKTTIRPCTNQTRKTSTHNRSLEICLWQTRKWRSSTNRSLIDHIRQPSYVGTLGVAPMAKAFWACD